MILALIGIALLLIGAALLTGWFFFDRWRDRWYRTHWWEDMSDG